MSNSKENSKSKNQDKDLNNDEKALIEAEKKKKSIVIKDNHYSNSWVSIVTIFLFFISFFLSYFVGGHELEITFVKSLIIFFVSNLLCRILVFTWKLTIPKYQWELITHGPPPVDSRSVRIEKEKTRRHLLEEERLAEMKKAAEELALLEAEANEIDEDDEDLNDDSDDDL